MSFVALVFSQNASGSFALDYTRQYNIGNGGRLAEDAFVISSSKAEGRRHAGFSEPFSVNGKLVPYVYVIGQAETGFYACFAFCKKGDILNGSDLIVVPFRK